MSSVPKLMHFFKIMSYRFLLL